MKKLTVILLIMILCASLLPGQARAGTFNGEVKEYTLKNGMKVIIAPRHELPVFTGIIMFDAGSYREYAGITGVSHLLEHMMFKGTQQMGTWDYKAEIPIMEEIDRCAHLWHQEKEKLRNRYGGGDTEKVKSLEAQLKTLVEKQRKYLVKNELWGTYMQHGGSHLNASTGNETVQYYVSLPSNRLELWAYLESDRLAHPVLREFYSERDVVNEERRMGENNPSSRLFKQFMLTALSGSPYRTPIVGFASDISTILREDAESYWKSCYSPGNAVIVLAGDLNPDEAIDTIKKYFDPIPGREKPRPVMTADDEQRGERRFEMEADANPSLLIGFQGPPYGSKEDLALTILSSILSEGRTSRLYRDLVEGKKLAESVRCFPMSYRYASLFVINAYPQASCPPEKLESALYEHLERIKTEPVEKAEMEKVMNNMETGFVLNLESNQGLAHELASAQLLTGDWRNFDEIARYREITPLDIQNAARTYLCKEKRTVATLVKKKKEAK